MPCSADGAQIATLPEERTVGREVEAVATRPQGQERNWSGKGGPELGPPNLHYHPHSFLRVHVRVHAGTHVCEGGVRGQPCCYSSEAIYFQNLIIQLIN